jgi:hypothetical protein
MIESVFGEIPILMNIFAIGSTIVFATYGLSELAAMYFYFLLFFSFFYSLSILL